MRPSGWAYIFVAVLTCSVAYPLFNRPSSPNPSPDVSVETERHPLDEKSDRSPITKDEARPNVDSAAVDLTPDQLPVAQEQARLEDAADAGPVEVPTPNEKKQNLSWRAYYAYSEIPPETKPADTVLDHLKDVQAGTPVDEIKRVADVLGLDVTFMKAVAKVESNFDPKQRTGSYIGLFQLSKYEFGK